MLSLVYLSSVKVLKLRLNCINPVFTNVLFTTKQNGSIYKWIICVIFFSSVDLQVAILDAYFCGPSIPSMMNVCHLEDISSSVLLGES